MITRGLSNLNLNIIYYALFVKTTNTGAQVSRMVSNKLFDRVNVSIYKKSINDHLKLV